MSTRVTVPGGGTVRIKQDFNLRLKISKADAVAENMDCVFQFGSHLKLKGA